MTALMSTSAILSYIAGKVIDSLIGKGAGKLSENIWGKFQKDETQTAFKEALGKTIHRYATSGTRFAIAQPLLDQSGPLTDKTVAEELSKVLRFDEDPDYQVIGSIWRNAVDDPPQWRDFSVEAKVLIDFFRQELLASDIFRPVFDTKTLIAINENTELAVDVFDSIEEQLVELQKSMEGKLGDLIKTIGSASLEVNSQVRDFTWYIQEKTHDFVGRKFVIDKVETFLKENKRGYYILRGDPGIGKTALLSQLVKNQGYIHHFNIRSSGANRADIFLKNICAQIIAAYDLKYTSLPDRAIEDGDFLFQLLREASAKLGSNQKLVMAIDALDEVDNEAKNYASNLLYLPATLPLGVYIVATSRDMDLRLRIECEQENWKINQNDTHNIDDIRDYIKAKALYPKTQSYIAEQKIDEDRFTESLVEKSQGNFMYLYHVLPEIERGDYRSISLDALPIGLKDYYEDHWRRMKGQNEEVWFKYKLPVIVALTVVKEAVSLDRLLDFSAVTEKARIIAVLAEWRQFLYETQAEYGGSSQKLYRLYHASFHDFVASKQEIAEEHVDLKAANAKIAISLLHAGYGNDRAL